jgi:hypothetical protein
MPILQRVCPGLGAGSPFGFLVPIIDLAAGTLPNLVKPWLDAFRDAPERLFAGALFVGVLSTAGSSLQGRIRDRMREIWKTPDLPGTVPNGGVYWLRNKGWYKAGYYILTHWILPSIFAFVILLMILALAWCAVAAVSRVSFLAVDASGGHICKASATVTEVTTQSQPRPFETATLCTATGLGVKKGQTYKVSLVITEGWEDGHKLDVTDPTMAKGIATGPNGFGWEKTTWKMVGGVPLRRLLASNWFATILRTGDRGFGETVLAFECENPPAGKCPADWLRYTASFKAPKDGEVFVYVNDAVVGWGDFARFYNHRGNYNKGKAELTIAPKAQDD